MLKLPRLFRHSPRTPAEILFTCWCAQCHTSSQKTLFSVTLCDRGFAYPCFSLNCCLLEVATEAFASVEELAGPLEEELEVAAALGSGRARVSDAAAVVVV